ncbi:MAG: DUF2208 domain-containing protein [Fervidicoccaceae archaeon]
MSAIMQSKKQILISQLSILLFAVVAGFLGRTGTLYWIFIFLYFIVYMYLMSKFGQPKYPSSAKAAELEKGKTLYEETKAFEYVSSDKQYALEMQEQMKAMNVSMMLSFVVLIYFFIAFAPVTSYIAPHFSDERIGMTVAYLTLFEGSFAISTAGQIYTSRKMKKQNKKMVMINVPRSFIVTTKGVILKGLTSSSGLKFPLSGFKIELNEDRKFVELTNETEKGIYKVRFYTKSPKKLYDIIMRRNEKIGEEEKEDDE